MDMPLATLEFDGDGDVPVARLTGELDASNVPELERALWAKAPHPDGMLVLDLTELVFLDSSGLRLIFDADKRLAELRLVVPDDSFTARLLQSTGADGILTVHPTLAAAVDSLSSAA